MPIHRVFNQIILGWEHMYLLLTGFHLQMRLSLILLRKAATKANAEILVTGVPDSIKFVVRGGSGGNGIARF